MNDKAKFALVLALVVVLGLPLVAKLRRDNAAEQVYNLVSIDANPVPYEARRQGRRGPKITSGTLTFKKDSTFLSTMEYANGRIGDDTSHKFKGTWKKEGDTYILKWENATETKVSYDPDDGSLIMNNEGQLYVYKR